MRDADTQTSGSRVRSCVTDTGPECSCATVHRIQATATAAAGNMAATGSHTRRERSAVIDSKACECCRSCHNIHTYTNTHTETDIQNQTNKITNRQTCSRKRTYKHTRDTHSHTQQHTSKDRAIPTYTQT